MQLKFPYRNAEKAKGLVSLLRGYKVDVTQLSQVAISTDIFILVIISKNN